jgi:hypothetical protein
VVARTSTTPEGAISGVLGFLLSQWRSLWGLRNRRGVALAMLLAAGSLVFLPAVRSEFLLDDYLHASMIDGSFPVARGPLNLYDFVASGERQLLVDRGMLPWWSHPELKIRFLRPLSSVLRWSEQHVLGLGAAGPHIHSLLWWMAAVIAARQYYRQLLSPRTAWLATAIFALSPCHALPIAWLANREALVSLTFGVLGLSCYHRWRKEHSARHALAAGGLFALALCGGEYALCIGGYVVAFELLGRGGGPGRWGQRIAGLLTYFVPAAAYLTIRSALGYGTHGSSFYNDPLHEPLAFLLTAPHRFATLVTQEWLTSDSDDAASLLITWALALAILVAAIRPIRHVLRSLEPSTRDSARALLLGSHLALVPVLAVDPSPRVLGLAMLGLAPIFALVMDHAWFPSKPFPERRGVAEMTGLLALGVGFFQLIHAPVTAYLIGAHYRRTSVDFVRYVDDLRERIKDPSQDQLLVLRGGPSSFFVPFALARSGGMPSRWRVLSTTGHALGLRKDARTVELVVPKDRSMLSWFSWDLFRNDATTFEAGQVIATPGLRATILEIGEVGPRRVRFELDRDLDDPHNVWITESGKGEFPAATLPRLGFGQPYEP